MIKETKFIQTLLRIVQNKELSNIVRWCDDGCGFVIINSKEFKDKVLLQEFQNPNYGTFQRNLNMYGFKIYRNQYNQKEYKNKNFTSLCTNISQVTRKIKKKKQLNLENQTCSLQILKDNNIILYEQLQKIKVQQQHVLKQFHLTYQFQLAMQSVMNKIFQRHFLKWNSEEEDKYKKIFLLLLNVICGMVQDHFSLICKAILEVIPYVPELEYACNLSPLPFWNQEN